MRKQVISRTVQMMKVTALLADTVDEQMVEGIFFIEKTDEKEILKSVAKQCGEGMVPVAVKETQIISGKYVMTLGQFMALAERVE
jgi:hypothetical protein